MDIKAIKQKIIKFYCARKILIWVGTAVLVITAIVLALFSSRSESVQENIEYVSVSRGSITESIGEVGFVEAQPSVRIPWTSGGIVGNYDLTVGDQVEKGDVLMELDFSSWPNASLQAQSDILDAKLAYENMVTSDTDFQVALQAVVDAEYTVRTTKEMRDFWNFGSSSDERIEAIRVNYESAEWKVRVLEEEFESVRMTENENDPLLVEAEKSLQEAKLERDNYLRLLNQVLGHSYDQIVQTDFNDYDQAKAALLRARAEYERLLDNSQELAAAKAKVQALENTINQAKIITPFDGTVTEIGYRIGESVEAGSIAIQVDDLDHLVVYVDVSEMDISKVAVDQQVVINCDALPYKEYSGSVIAISNAGTDDSGSVQFRVTVAINDEDESIKSGFTAVVSIITSEAEDVLLVPSQAIRSQNGSSMVMLVGEDGMPMPVAVEVGASSDTHTEISSGEIKEGDQLMVAANLISNGFGGGGFGIMGGMRQITGGGGQRPPNNR